MAQEPYHEGPPYACGGTTPLICASDGVTDSPDGLTDSPDGLTKAETALCNGLSVLNGMPRTNYQAMVDEGFIKSALSEEAQCCGVKYELKTVANY